LGSSFHVALIFDRAGWHTTRELKMPTNVKPIWLPSRSSELNPVENVLQYLRQNWLSNRAFETYHDILDAACDA
jgi:transposase